MTNCHIVVQCSKMSIYIKKMCLQYLILNVLNETDRRTEKLFIFKNSVNHNITSTVLL